MGTKKKLEKKSFKHLKREVIDVGLCVGCGICSGVCPDEVIALSGQEQEPRLVGECLEKCGPGACYHSCPGRYIPMPEMEKMVFGRTRNLENQTEYLMGITNGFFAAHATDNTTRIQGASGGTATALLGYALDKGIVDAILVAGFREDKPWVTEPKVITNKKDLLNWQGSVYSRVPMGKLLNTMAKSGFEKIGIIGLPCFIHGLRKIQLHHFPAGMGEKIAFVMGLICGTSCTVEGLFHVLREWIGIEAEEVERLNFRGGEWPGSLVIHTRDGRTFSIPKGEYWDRFLVTMFRASRCMRCWDFVGDLADLCLGDYWGAPRSTEEDKAGWNAVIIKTPLGKSLVEGARSDQYVKLELMPMKHIFDMPGWELKKHSNSYLMAARRQYGEPIPDYGYETDSYLKPLPSQRQVYTPRN